MNLKTLKPIIAVSLLILSLNACKKQNSTSTVLMVRPTNFGNIAQSADSSMAKAGEDWFLNQMNADLQFESFVSLLKENGINVIVVEDTPNPVTPYSIFPSRWFSTQPDGNTVLYPLSTPGMREARKHEVMDVVTRVCGPENHITDLTSWEDEGKFLEGNGSLVLDRAKKIAYACISPVTSEEAVDDFCSKMGYKAVKFNAKDAKGQTICHTDRVLCVGTGMAVLCKDAISSPEDLKKVKKSLEKSGKDILYISFSQMEKNAGNMLELNNGKRKTFFVMSQTAYSSLEERQIEKINKYGSVIAADIHTIEKNSNGSARSMLAEIYKPEE